MMASIGGSVELQALFCAILLGILHLLLSVGFNVAGRGLRYGVGARDESPKPLGKWASRTERAYKNFLETFAFFAAAVLLAHALGKSTHGSVLGAQIYLWSRVIYLPVYILGIPVLRTLAWVASLAGIMMVMRAIWPGW